jgi:magnesium transporter
MSSIMRNVSHDQIVADFEELVAENQIQTATELLVSAEPEVQVLIVNETRPVLLDRFLQALDPEDRIEVTGQLAAEARQHLLHVLAGTPIYVAEAGALPGRVDFAIVDGRLVTAAPGSAAVTVYSNPTSAAQRDLLESLGIDEHMLESALDPDEISRLEYDEEEQQTFIVLKRPHREAHERPELLGIASVGVFLQHDRLIVVSPDETPIVRAGDRAESPRRLLLRIMDSTVNEFLMELKRVKRTSRDIQAQLTKSLGNRELLRMFSLSEGLVYHINAIESNGRVLRKLRHLARRLGFEEGELEFLDDIVIDNDQCSRQGEVFSTVLAGMLDARGNIVNNNMNVLLKNLTIINVVFLPLTLIASIGGMSEFSVMLADFSIDWRIGYPLFAAAVVVLGFVIWLIVRRIIGSGRNR